MEEKRFPVTHSDEEWRRLLTPEQYDILRGHGTEAPGSCALNYEKRAGTFVLRRLRTGAVRVEEEVRERHRLAELQRSGRQARSRPRPIAATAWCAPRCIAAAAAAISATCSTDGPPPTHLRYCINGVAMNFKPE